MVGYKDKRRGGGKRESVLGKRSVRLGGEEGVNKEEKLTPSGVRDVDDLFSR